jgi:hypothetical protein
MEVGLEGKSDSVVEERSSPRVELEEWTKLGSEVERRVVKIGELAVKPEKAIPAMRGIVRNVGWWGCYWKGMKALYVGVGLTTIKLHSNMEANLGQVNHDETLTD